MITRREGVASSMSQDLKQVREGGVDSVDSVCGASRMKSMKCTVCTVDVC